MKNKVYLSSVALLVGGIALSGCAPKKAWSPELAEARVAYERAASNPAVTTLAATELEEAQRQLQSAEEAADFFKSREEIAHEAEIAQLRSAEAEHAARALQAKQNLRIVKAGSPYPPEALAPQALPGNSESSRIVPNQNHSNTPVLAAARHHSGAMVGGSSAESQQVALQVAALSQQIALLQAQVTSGSLQDSTDFYQQPAMQTEYAELAAAPTTSYGQTETQSLDLLAEPSIGAARPSQDTSNIYVESGNKIQPSAFSNAPAVVSDARLREELRAMNARPSSNGMTLTLGERYFESGSARLWNGRAGRHLDNVAAVMVENPGLVIDIEAHTDNQGSNEQRNNLTADRATSIKSALVLRGVDASRINSTGFGDSSPKADNTTSLGRLQNRRVEIIFPNVDGI